MAFKKNSNSHLALSFDQNTFHLDRRSHTFQSQTFFLIILKYFNTICQLSDILKRRLQSYHNVSHQKFLVKASSLFQTNRIIKYQISPLFQERSLKDMHSSSVEVSPHLPKGSKARTYNLVYTPVPQQKITGMILQCQLTDSSRYSGKLSISAANKSNS